MIAFAIITSYRIARFCSQLRKFELFDLIIENISEIFSFSFVFRMIKEPMISKRYEALFEISQPYQLCILSK
jgi:hypothetical protein